MPNFVSYPLMYMLPISKCCQKILNQENQKPKVVYQKDLKIMPQQKLCHFFWTTRYKEHKTTYAYKLKFRLFFVIQGATRETMNASPCPDLQFDYKVHVYNMKFLHYIIHSSFKFSRTARNFSIHKVPKFFLWETQKSNYRVLFQFQLEKLCCGFVAMNVEHKNYNVHSPNVIVELSWSHIENFTIGRQRTPYSRCVWSFIRKCQMEQLTLDKTSCFYFHFIKQLSITVFRHDDMDDSWVFPRGPFIYVPWFFHYFRRTILPAHTYLR